MKRRESYRLKRRRHSDVEQQTQIEAEFSSPLGNANSTKKGAKTMPESIPFERSEDNDPQKQRVSSLTSPKTRRGRQNQETSALTLSSPSRKRTIASKTQPITKKMSHITKSSPAVNSSQIRKRKRNSEQLNYFQKRRISSSETKEFEDKEVNTFDEIDEHAHKKLRLSVESNNSGTSPKASLTISPTLQTKLKLQQSSMTPIGIVTSETDISHTIAKLKQEKLKFVESSRTQSATSTSSPLFEMDNKDDTDQREDEVKGVPTPSFGETESETPSVLSTESSARILSSFNYVQNNENKYLIPPHQREEQNSPYSPNGNVFRQGKTSPHSTDYIMTPKVSAYNLTKTPSKSHIKTPTLESNVKFENFTPSQLWRKLNMSILVVISCLLLGLLSLLIILIVPSLFQYEKLRQEKLVHSLYEATITRLQEQRGAYECGEEESFFIAESDLKLYLMQHNFANEAIAYRVLSQLSQHGYNNSNQYFHPLPIYSIKCLMKFWLKDNWQYITTAFTLIFVILYLRYIIRTRREEKLLLLGLVSRIHGILKSQKKRSLKEPGVEAWVPKLHIRDQIITSYNNKSLWKKAEEMIVRDSRILETPKLVSGEQMDVWLWVGDL